jgi:hypothetical protein
VIQRQIQPRVSRIEKVIILYNLLFDSFVTVMLEGEVVIGSATELATVHNRYDAFIL